MCGLYMHNTHVRGVYTQILEETPEGMVVVDGTEMVWSRRRAGCLGGVWGGVLRRSGRRHRSAARAWPWTTSASCCSPSTVSLAWSGIQTDRRPACDRDGGCGLGGGNTWRRLTEATRGGGLDGGNTLEHFFHSTQSDCLNRCVSHHHCGCREEVLKGWHHYVCNNVRVIPERAPLYGVGVVGWALTHRRAGGNTASSSE